ncbi:hypothetical protein [Aeromicrobium duanguangcaii]|uniref:Uncharacterized protein n=1 Tax=Aeromicrobium duanguangcaii TaxID=2968086 RepID=A0ABY5KFV6_9ACTN|nr:hypothetical protein [Aeromicrobium duanguangcaii]MCD9154045.1 hypothetical protein [Aeromicrobium duanguangcaii]MCL3837780.1 hypothetical protein [Aeromicrobium duanguangcaii]UUI68878.1 hypothetical protein NP095_01865 [Aeromicrobium duanguangcaii]
MSHGRPDLRLDAPTLEPSEDVVQRLAATARLNGSPRAARRHRLAIVAASFLGVSAISAGGAWAVGAIEVPLLPASPLKPAAVAPDPPRDRHVGQPARGAPAAPGAEVASRLPARLPASTPEADREAPRIVDRPARSMAREERRPDARRAAPEESRRDQGRWRRDVKGDRGRDRGRGPEKSRPRQDRDERFEGRGQWDHDGDRRNERREDRGEWGMTDRDRPDGRGGTDRDRPDGRGGNDRGAGDD